MAVVVGSEVEVVAVGEFGFVDEVRESGVEVVAG